MVDPGFMQIPLKSSNISELSYLMGSPSKENTKANLPIVKDNKVTNSFLRICEKLEEIRSASKQMRMQDLEAIFHECIQSSPLENKNELI